MTEPFPDLSDRFDLFERFLLDEMGKCNGAAENSVLNKDRWEGLRTAFFKYREINGRMPEQKA